MCFFFPILEGRQLFWGDSEVSPVWYFATSHALWLCIVSLGHVAMIKITTTTLRPTSVLQQHHVKLLKLKNGCDYAPTFSFFFANTCFILNCLARVVGREKETKQKKKPCCEKEENLIPCPGSCLPETLLENTVSSLGKGVFLSLSSFCCLTAHFISRSQDIFHVASWLKIYLNLHTQTKKQNKTKEKAIICRL